MLEIPFFKYIHLKSYLLTGNGNVFRWLTAEVGVTPIPPSAFYTPLNKPLAANLGTRI